MLALCWNLVYKADLKFAALLGLGVRISSGSLDLIIIIFVLNSQNFYVFLQMKNKYNMKNLSKIELQKVVTSCSRWADLCRALELKPTGGNYQRVKKIVYDNNIDTSHFSTEPWNKGKKIKTESYYFTDIKNLLIENSPHKNSSKLKKRLFREDIKQKQCEICGLTDTSITLELHHINGDPTDNRLENLQILCPNCHSKTSNFRGKNTRIHKCASELFLSDEEVEQRRQEKLNKRRIPIEQRKNKPVINIKCLWCNKEFKPRSKQTKYCCVECYRADNASNRPSVLELIDKFKQYKTFVGVAKSYNITDNGVRKWCRLYKIPDTSKKMKEFLNQINI